MTHFLHRYKPFDILINVHTIGFWFKLCALSLYKYYLYKCICVVMSVCVYFVYIGRWLYCTFCKTYSRDLMLTFSDENVLLNSNVLSCSQYAHLCIIKFYIVYSLVTHSQCKNSDSAFKRIIWMLKKGIFFFLFFFSLGLALCMVMTAMILQGQ